MNYNEILTNQIDGKEIQYGILLGNETIVFIKTGVDGDIYGYKNKYPKIAHRIHKRLGATVICSSNPDTNESQVDADKKTIESIAAKTNPSAYKVLFFGTSDGAYHNLSLATLVPQTDKILCVNPSFIEIEDFNNKLLCLSNVRKTIICGSKDDDYNIIMPSIEKIKNHNLEIITIHGADHNFTNMVDEFISLIDLL